MSLMTNHVEAPTMSDHPSVQDFRADLLSPVAFHRVKALHALECQAEAIEGTPLGRELIGFVSRGIPYYSLEDPHYQVWVAQAVKHWERVGKKASAALAA
jgi:hypothetical protein